MKVEAIVKYDMANLVQHVARFNHRERDLLVDMD